MYLTDGLLGLTFSILGHVLDFVSLGLVGPFDFCFGFGASMLGFISLGLVGPLGFYFGLGASMLGFLGFRTIMGFRPNLEDWAINWALSYHLGFRPFEW